MIFGSWFGSITFCIRVRSFEPCFSTAFNDENLMFLD